MTRPQRQFAAEVRGRGSLAIIDLHGELDGFAEAGLDAAYAEAMEGRPQAVLLNFGDVDYINSTGIALIVGLLAQARTSRLQLLTSGLSEHYQEIFRITRLADFMSMVADEGAAMKEIEAG